MFETGLCLLGLLGACAFVHLGFFCSVVEGRPSEIWLTNTGSSAWPEGATLCRHLPRAIEGNASEVLDKVMLICAQDGGEFAYACPEISIRTSARLVITIIFKTDQVTEAWHHLRFSLCDPRDSRPFGVIFAASVSFK